MEIEHKYLVSKPYKQYVSESHHIIQGYLSDSPERTVRIRLCDDNAFITIKGKSSASGLSRYEWEKQIPKCEALELLQLCLPGTIDKHRHIIIHDGNKWEVDEFHGHHEGLVLAEIEVPQEDYKFTLPPFIGEEVTGRKQYYNSQLRKNSSSNGLTTD